MTTTAAPSTPSPVTGPRSATAPRRPTRRPSPWTYVRVETLATLRRADTLFFTIIMPLGMYLLFGKMSEFETMSVGNGNITASIMVNMSTYSAAIAATTAAASAAVEQAGGWGRQIALTAGGMRTYATARLISALLVSLFPLVLIFAAGALTGAVIDSPQRWAACFLICLGTTVPFAIFGLAAGLWFPSNTATGVAGASISVFAFLGNLFMPLSGLLFTIAHYTPLYGPGSLAVRPLQGDTVATTTGLVEEPVWYGLANLVAWTLVFTLMCVAARRRSTVRQ
ncbi:MAG: ABC transporter [Actinomyces sp.]|uniref:ABC transporter n=1 Tax=Actinomyces sp. TaxID=29317 RepID=UPI0026DC2764|nr:ABC transporter [Actinomyces sp.]MDO4243137.1 ABC transporter [Actinomyces sp.]